MFSNPWQVAPPGIEPGTYRTISENLYQCATLPILILFLSSLDNLVQDAIIIFQKRCW